MFCVSLKDLANPEERRGDAKYCQNLSSVLLHEKQGTPQTPLCTCMKLCTPSGSAGQQRALSLTGR